MRYNHTALLRRTCQRTEHLLQNSLAVDGRKFRQRHAHPRVGQQVRNELLHAGGTVHRVADVLIRLGIQPALVAVPQQLQERGDHAQRLLQVMRSYVCERLQVGVGTGQFCCLFGLLAFGEVANDAREKGAFARFPACQRKLDREFISILPSSG